MTPEDTPPSSDPLFGNAASDLLREAVGTEGKPLSDPRFWQPPTPEELQSRLEGYVIEAFLARGGMGAVYRGMQTSLERHVAIKILPPLLQEHDASFALRFKQEARAMAQLNHPGIVSVYDFGEMSDGTLYFIMEFIDGTDVARMVHQQGRLSSAHAMAITAHVCDALQYAHENDVVHRDIKPANIMVGQDGRVKVADFGLAKSFNSGHTSLTMTGHVMGTPHFVAPEALTLGSSVDHRADIYAVGVMLYQMLTGRLPQGIFEMPSLLIAGLDPRYDAIIAAAMREDRNARYQAIYEMRHALDAIITQPVAQSQATFQRSAPTKPNPGQHFQRPHQAAAAQPHIQKKSSTGTWLLAAAVVLSLCGIVWMKMGDSASPSTTSPLAESVATAPANAPTNAATLPKPATVAPGSPSVSDAQPANSISKPGEVRLEFKNADRFYDVGGYQPSELPLSTKMPRSIVKVPVDLGPALYGELVLGPKTRQRTHAVIVSHPKTPKSRLFVDRNANGDLTDDPPAGWKPDKQSNAATKEQWEVFQGEFMADLSCDDGEHPARFEVFQKTSASLSFDSLWIHPQYGRIGLVNLDDGRNYKALLYDDGAVGDFSASSSTLRIDLTGEGGFRKENKEVFPVMQPIEIKGVSYELRGLTPSGDKFVLVPGSNTPPASSPNFRTFTNSKGQTLRASLIRVQNDDVTLKRDDGQEFTLKASTLSEPDIEYLRTKGLVMPAAGQPAAATVSPASLAALWKNRCTAAERLETLLRTGGSPEVEVGVSAALHDLKAIQNPNGSWGGEGRSGKTALALLSYLGRCETMESKDFGDPVIKGIMFLIEMGKKSSSGILAAEAASSHADMEHAMATEALAQMYLTARYGSKSLPGMRETFEKGIRLIIQSQATASGREKTRLLALAWQAEALNTARLTTLKFDGLSESVSRLALLIKQAQKPDGSFSGQAAETPQAITGACVRALQILPGDHQSAIAKGIQFARQHYQKEPLDRAKMDLHAVFFCTRAFFHQGGDDWKFWNQQMLPQALSAQKPDGSFSCPLSSLMPGEDVDNTALAALTLETYFRDTPK